MSRKVNVGGGRKARGVGGCSHSKHRSSGHKGSASRPVREAMAGMLTQPRRPRTERLYVTVAELMLPKGLGRGYYR